MGCTNSHAPEDHNPQQFYTTAASKNNVYKPLNNTDRQEPANGNISVQTDKYDAVNNMMNNYQPVQAINDIKDDYQPQRHGSVHSVLSSHMESSVAALCEKLELNISLRNIPKMDLISPSDPFCIISIKDEVKNYYLNVGKTEIVWDNPNPDFSDDLRINYMFEEVQYVKIDIYDANEKQTTNLSKHDYIGCVEFIVGDLVTANGQKLVMAIEDKYGRKLKKVKGLQPLVIVRAQEIDENYDEIELKFSGRGLPKMDAFGKIDGFFQIYRKTNDNNWASIYKSEHIPSNYNPSWKQFNVETRRLCNGDMNRPILIRCWDWNRDAKPDYACEIKTTLAQLIDAREIKWRQWNFKKKRYNNKNCGELVIEHSNIIKKHSFVSFLRGGLQLQLMVAIDFTGSNGDPRDQKSLHYMGPPNHESQYMKVIKSVGRVLEPYDADGDIGAYGFGANLDPYGKRVSHCFNITLQDGEEEVPGIDGLCEAYKSCLEKVQLYGPTYFSEILNNISAKSHGICSQKDQSYHILLIITDGVINDMQRSIDAIVDATRLPLSIIIVGVGDANFENMEILDADDNPLKHSGTGKLMQRDIVQFVPFNEFKDKHISTVAREVLEEVPRQVTSFMSMHSIHPNPPQIEQSRSDGLYDNIHHAEEKKDEMDHMKMNMNNDDIAPMSIPTAPFSQQPPAQNPYYNANANNNLPTRNDSNGKEGTFTAPGFGPGS